MGGHGPVTIVRHDRSGRRAACYEHRKTILRRDQPTASSGALESSSGGEETKAGQNAPRGQ